MAQLWNLCDLMLGKSRRGLFMNMPDARTIVADGSRRHEVHESSHQAVDDVVFASEEDSMTANNCNVDADAAPTADADNTARCHQAARIIQALARRRRAS